MKTTDAALISPLLSTVGEQNDLTRGLIHGRTAVGLSLDASN